MTRWRRIKRFFLWLLPARKVKAAEFWSDGPSLVELDAYGGYAPGREGPRNLGGWSDLPYDDSPVLLDYRTEGPEEARQIATEKRPCETAPNGTGSRCTCGFDCANYWLRANGFKGEGVEP